MRFVRIAPLAAGLLLALPTSAKLVVKEILLHGAEKTSVRTIRARMQLSEGDSITFDVLADARERLLATGLFSAAEVRVDMRRLDAVHHMYLTKDVASTDLHVTIEEKQSWFVFPIASGGGGAYSGGLVYFDRNLAGQGFELASAMQLGTNSSFVQAGFREPMMSFAPLTYGLHVFYRNDLFDFYDEHVEVQRVPMQSAGAELKFGYNFGRGETKALTGIGYQRLWVDAPTELAPDGTATTPQEPLTCLGGALLDATNSPVALVQPYNCRAGDVDYVLFELVHDRTIAPQGIRRGGLVSIGAEIADEFWRSDFDYVKFDTRIGLYGHLAGTYPSVAFRFALVFPTSPSGVPLSKTFRLGGGDLRGYNVNEFHGDTLLTLQVEDLVPIFRFRRPWRMNIVGAVFSDLGILLERHPGGRVEADPALRVEPRPSLSDVHMGIGTGLRLLLPGVAIPAIRLDFGYGLDVRDYAIKFSLASN